MLRKILVFITRKTGLYKFAVQIDTFIVQKKMQKSFKKFGLEALIQADKALRSVNSFVFLNFGTLLGAYRDKGFIPYDCDLDAGILAKNIPENMPEILQKHGFKHVKQFYLKETGKIVEDVYNYKGVQIDFFIYFEKDDELYCYLGRRHETKTPEKANAEDGFPSRLSWGGNAGFSESEFLGHRFFIPANAAQWLEDVYGASYMTPIKRWSEFKQKTRIEFHDERLYRRYFE